MTATKKQRVPALRFPEFREGWEEKSIGAVTDRYVNSVEVNEEEWYREIGIRSHGKGIFHKELIKGESLGNKRVFWIKENAFIVNIVFAWEQAVAKTTINEVGFIASHRFPMYLPRKGQSSTDYLLHFFLTRKGKTLLELASPGGAGRNKTLGQKEFEKTSFYLPSLSEQQKIAEFLCLVDKRIELLKEKKKNLEAYKKGVMQQIFSQTLRFKNKNGNNYPKWEEKKLREILIEHKTKNNNKHKIEEVFSVAKHQGVINQIEHLGRSYAGEDTSNYKVVYPNDVIYTKSPTSDFPFGIVKQNKLDRTGIVSTLYAVFRPKSQNIGYILDSYFLSPANTYNYLVPLVQKGAKNTMNISNNDFLDGAVIPLPVDEEEQQKIVDFLSAIDDPISLSSTQIKESKNYKKGLLQQMFV
ncbi:restriction endonuclease subunit S [Dysgonomonas sp. HDW5B]|uniref:restriction endonuclease subunit S n=1 Tax=Dysgonomonas sp. HDW5B TaxID=2714927 RepID=UPI00140D5C5B|nr:restriction endonuclease subunit S [Dysgonomonas sp. HDW5B]QIK53119.1 restriction endonuclease subunit S [Dysgonomonas sp. HDW5B]